MPAALASHQATDAGGLEILNIRPAMPIRHVYCLTQAQLEPDGYVATEYWHQTR
jgi:hypothetical protein